MENYDYWADDESKVVPIGTEDDEYEPEEDDIPIEERKKREDSEKTIFEAKSGEKVSLKAPKVLKFPVVDESGNPLAGQLYIITLPSGKMIFGETDDQGILKEKIDESGDVNIEMEDGSEITIETE